MAPHKVLSLRLPESWIERIELLIVILLQLAICVVTVAALIREQHIIAFAGCLTFAMTFAPWIIERRLGVQMPIELTLVTCVFLYAAFALGEVEGFYARFPWWDLMLHGFSAFIIGLIGFLLVYSFYMTHRIRVAPIFVALIASAFAVTIGTVWEIFEFLMDWLFGLNMQKSGLIDTMTDLLVNIIGAFLAALIGYRYVKGTAFHISRRLIEHLVQRGPRIE